jgi:hypothetical protein
MITTEVFHISKSLEKSHFYFGASWVLDLRLPFSVHEPDWRAMRDETHGWGRVWLWVRFWAMAIRYALAVKHNDPLTVNRLLSLWAPAIRHIDWYAQREAQRRSDAGRVGNIPAKGGVSHGPRNLNANVNIGTGVEISTGTTPNQPDSFDAVKVKPDIINGTADGIHHGGIYQ